MAEMIRVRPAAERGHFDHGWLDTHHTFSFADYVDPEHMGYRTLRVINDDVIAPSAGFGMHPHRDMEIITYVIRGAVRHRDNRGNDAVLPAGGFQVMSAGRGIMHSEHNGEDQEPTRLLQIWIRPDTPRVEPQYADRVQRPAEPGQWDLVAAGGTVDLAPEGARRSAVLPIHQDARVYHLQLRAGQLAEYPLAAGRGAWLQIAEGDVTVNEQPLHTGDGAAVESEARVSITATSDADLLLFDLA
jgi:redox-sensitive bicupin YhaK (pirin superfamily)